MKHITSRILALVLSLSAASALAAEFDVPEIEAEGLVQAVDFGNNEAVISGVVYHFPIGAKIEITGTYGAFTMLEPGMKVEFIFEKHDDSRREVIELLPGARLSVVTSDGAGADSTGLLESLLGDAAATLQQPFFFLRQLIAETGHAVLDRMIERGTPDAGTLSDLYTSFAVKPTLAEIRERLAIDKVTVALLEQRFQEDLEAIRELDAVEVV